MYSLVLLQASQTVSIESSWGEYVKMLLLLAALLALCYFGLRMASNKLIPRKQRATGSLEVIDRLGLEPRRSLYVVRAGASYLALASSESGIQFLTQLNPADFVIKMPQTGG